MLIALLAVLGVDLIVLVVVAAAMVGRRRWLKRQPGEFLGAIRVTGGEVHGLGAKWKHGSGRWVANVLVWSKGPFLYRDELVPVDSQLERPPTDTGNVKRLGNEPVAAAFAVGDAVVELATKAELRALMIGPFAARSRDEAFEGYESS